MAKFLQRRRVEHYTNHIIEFFRKSDNSGCYNFPCDKDGNVLEAELCDSALENYRAALENESLYKKHKSWDSRSVIPAIIECECCQKPVYLTDVMTNTCECGADYNGSGQLLAPREQWGWDTGETLEEILKPMPYDFHKDCGLD